MEGRKKVLIVDDDPEVVKVMGMMLNLRGFDVVEALCGMKGCLLARRERPDIILLDIMMPDIDGFEVCRRLRLDSDTHDIPVIFVSAKTGQDHIDRGLSLGAQGYIKKPFELNDLLREINKLV